MSSDRMSIQLEARDDARYVFTLGGEIDVATAPTLRAALLDAAESKCHHIIVDLSRVEFLDSTGLGVLIGASKRAKENGGDCRLVARDGQILRLLRITGLLGVLAVYPSVDAALADDARLVGL